MGNPESWNVLAAIMNIPVFWIIFAAVLMILEFWAAMRIVKSDAGRESKMLWILMLVFVPVVSFVAWIFFGPKGRSTASM